MQINKYIIYALLAVIVLAGISTISGWNKSQRSSTPVNTWVKAPAPKYITKYKTVYLPGPAQIATIEKEKIVEKQKLPDEIAKDPNKQITGVAEVPAYEGTTTVDAVFDLKTGKTDMSMIKNPVSFFGLENKIIIGGRIGYLIEDWKLRGDVYGQYNFLRMGKSHLGLYGEVSNNSKAMIDYHFEF